MQLNETARTEKNNKIPKFMKIILFWTNFLLLVIVSKKIFKSPTGNIDFLVKNAMTFICAIIITVTMLKFFNYKILKICIPIIWVLTILLFI